MRAIATNVVPMFTPAGSLDLAVVEERLSAAFLARFGRDVGPDITAESMAWAWEHREELEAMENPVGYLFRVGQSKSRRFFRWKRERVSFPDERRAVSAASDQQPWTEPGLPRALSGLKPEARTPIILVHCLQWTYAEVAELLDVPLHTVRNRVHRGLAQLRTDLGVEK